MCNENNGFLVSHRANFRFTEHKQVCIFFLQVCIDESDVNLRLEDCILGAKLSVLLSWCQIVLAYRYAIFLCPWDVEI